MASGETLNKSGLIRFVVGPDNYLTPDVAEKLPGRGVWVKADRASLEAAIEKKAFARGLKSRVTVPDDLVDMVDRLLAKRVLGLFSMALKSGGVLLGFDQVRSAAREDALAWRIEASDGSPDGRGKIRVLTKAVSRELERPIPAVIGCFTASELGQAFARESVVHAALRPGPLAGAVSSAATRLSGFRALIPDDWSDKAHEAG